jgi:hypothetical protein
MYVFPVEGFERDMPDSELIKAYLNGKIVKRYTPEAFAGLLNAESINPDNYWVRAMDDCEGLYSIAFLHIDDLKTAGFDTENVSESDMSEIAQRLNDHFMDWMYWESLSAIACDMNIPRLNGADTDRLHHNQPERAS